MEWKSVIYLPMIMKGGSYCPCDEAPPLDPFPSFFEEGVMYTLKVQKINDVLTPRFCMRCQNVAFGKCVCGIACDETQCTYNPFECRILVPLWKNCKLIYLRNMTSRVESAEGGYGYEFYMGLQNQLLTYSLTVTDSYDRLVISVPGTDVGKLVMHAMNMQEYKDLDNISSDRLNPLKGALVMLTLRFAEAQETFRDGILA